MLGTLGSLGPEAWGTRAQNHRKKMPKSDQTENSVQNTPVLQKQRGSSSLSVPLGRKQAMPGMTPHVRPMRHKVCWFIIFKPRLCSQTAAGPLWSTSCMPHRIESVRFTHFTSCRRPPPPTNDARGAARVERSAQHQTAAPRHRDSLVLLHCHAHCSTRDAVHPWNWVSSTIQSIKRC